MRALSLAVAAIACMGSAGAQPRVTAVVNGASFQPVVAPGSFATAGGTGLAAATATASTANWPTALGGVTATVNGVPAPLHFVSAGQINFQVPRNTPPGQASLVVRVNNVASAPFAFPVATAAPGILVSGSQAVAQHAGGAIVTRDNPVSAGSAVVLYLTGIGPVSAVVADGVPSPSSPLARATLAASATVGGRPASIAFLGLTPGFVGLAQANVTVPDLPTGDYPVTITIGGAASSATAPALSVIRGPSLSLLSATLNIDARGTDSYTLHGAFSNLSLDGASSILFALGQFAASIPIGEFARQADTGFLVYEDRTGLAPYWVSRLEIDPAARTFTARAGGIALAGLRNPFPLRFGAGSTAGCTMARMQRAGDSYALAASGADAPCLISGAGVGPVLAGGRRTARVEAAMDLTAEFDPRAVRVYRADDNGRQAGGALCTLAAQSPGLYACDVTVEEPRATLIPLVVEATAGARTLLSPGFSLNVVRAADAADSAQITSIENAMDEARRHFAEFGESAHARSLAMAALRSLFPAGAGMTAQPVRLSEDGVSIDVRAESGLMITMLRNLPLAPVAQRSAAAVSPPKAEARAHAATAGGPLTRTQIVETGSALCGEPSRDIVRNHKVLLWSTWDLFLNERGPERHLAALVGSKCPKFDPPTVVLSANATPASLAQMADFGTVILMSHGGVDPNNRLRGGLLTASTDRRLVDSDSVNYGWARVDYYATAPDGTRTVRSGGFVAVYAGNPHLRRLERSVVFGAFCYSNLMAGSLAGPTAAYYGYNAPTDDVTAGNDAFTVFESMVNRYDSAGEVRGAAPLTGNARLAYVGNPRLTVPAIGRTGPYPVNPGSTLRLEAELEGAEKCDGVMQLHWKNTALAGTLRPAKRGSGQNDYKAADTEAIYSASSSPAAPADDITVDFLPNAEPGDEAPLAARACTSVLPGRKGVTVRTTGVFNYGREGPPRLTNYTPPREVTTASPFTLTDTSLGGSSTVRVEQTGRNTWKVTQQVSSPKRTDIETQTWNRIDLELTNAPGVLQTRVRVEGSISGTCQALDVNFAGAGAPIRHIDDGNNGCRANWDIRGFTRGGTNSSASLSLNMSTLGELGSTYGAATGTITTTIELLDSSDPFFPD